jgi:probable poly-beta-1,6-N-acetyl-D-glucosamine export protein
LKLQKKIYDPAIDTLRLISILAVVLIHTTTRELEVTHYDLVHQTLTLFLNQASRFAVPLFFMISGFVLQLNYSPTDIWSYLKKRVSRLFIPYIFWSLIYYFLIYKNHADGFFSTLLTGNASYQLYFIPSLFIFYLIFPFIHQFFRIIQNKFIFLILFVMQILILNYDYQFHTSPLSYPIAVCSFNFFVFILGMYFANNRIKIIKFLNRYWPILLAITITASYFIFNEGKVNYLNTYNYLAFYSQWRPSVLIYTISLAGILYFVLSHMNINLLNKLSKLSFFVFFVHVIVLEAIWKYVYTNDSVFFGSVLAISLSIGYLVHQIKFLSRVTG